jgi:hypothetical protein
MGAEDGQEMNESPQNPSSNQLRPGGAEDQLRVAVDRSGYPLKAAVGDLLRPDHSVFEECGYVDRDTKELRAVYPTVSD